MEAFKNAPRSNSYGRQVLVLVMPLARKTIGNVIKRVQTVARFNVMKFQFFYGVRDGMFTFRPSILR